MDLLQTHITGQLIDAYFQLYNTSYPVLHEATFRDKLAASPPNISTQAPRRALCYMVLAIGGWCSIADPNRSQTSQFYNAAKANFSSHMLESGTFETVQAFLLMGNYSQKRDWTNTGYNYIGLACRMALGLGLHREFPKGPDVVGHERRRQVFWTLYCFESGFNITTGRPPTLIGGFIDTALPRNIMDQVMQFRLCPA